MNAPISTELLGRADSAGELSRAELDHGAKPAFSWETNLPLSADEREIAATLPTAPYCVRMKEAGCEPLYLTILAAIDSPDAVITAIELVFPFEGRRPTRFKCEAKQMKWRTEPRYLRLVREAEDALIGLGPNPNLRPLREAVRECGGAV